jgi:hypothetical protein
MGDKKMDAPDTPSLVFVKGKKFSKLMTNHWAFIYKSQKTPPLVGGDE